MWILVCHIVILEIVLTNGITVFSDVALFTDDGVHVLYKVYERIQCYSAEFSTKYNITPIKIAQTFCPKENKSSDIDTKASPGDRVLVEGNS